MKKETGKRNMTPLPSVAITLRIACWKGWACAFAAERGIEIHAPVQDALLVGGSVDEIEDIVAATQEAMAQASDLVLDGFILRSDAKIVRYPDRYSDERGEQMWDRVMRLLDAERLNTAVAAA